MPTPIPSFCICSVPFIWAVQSRTRSYLTETNVIVSYMFWKRNQQQRVGEIKGLCSGLLTSSFPFFCSLPSFYVFLLFAPISFTLLIYFLSNIPGTPLQSVSTAASGKSKLGGWNWDRPPGRYLHCLSRHPSKP